MAGNFKVNFQRAETTTSQHGFIRQRPSRLISFSLFSRSLDRLGNCHRDTEHLDHHQVPYISVDKTETCALDVRTLLELVTYWMILPHRCRVRVPKGPETLVCDGLLTLVPLCNTFISEVTKNNESLLFRSEVVLNWEEKWGREVPRSQAIMMPTIKRVSPTFETAKTLYSNEIWHRNTICKCQRGGAAVFEAGENGLTSLPSRLPLRLLSDPKGPPPTSTRHDLTRRNLTVI